MAERITPVSTYLLVFAGLIGFTFLTLAISLLPAGPWHTPAGLAIAVAKALLVALFFMHLIHSSRAHWLAAITGVFWLGILIVLTMADYLTRWVAY